MTSRNKNSVRSFETEIEKSREESNWRKAVDLAQQLKARSPQHESLAHFLIGEGKLEAYLTEWPPIKDNIERAQRELSEARGYLALATDEAGRKAGVALDAHLLLGKLNYASGAYDEALKHYKNAELNTLTEKELPVRSLRIVAESYAIKGFCLEQTAVIGSSRYKQAEREAEMLRSFELASDLTMLYLQKTSSSKIPAGPTLEAALLRVPLLHLQAGRLHNAVERYREMLAAVEAPSTQALRLTLTRQLAEVLLRGLTGQVYRPPEKLPTSTQANTTSTLNRRRDDAATDGLWKPKRYYALNQFVPRTDLEEVILVLLIGEAMAVRDAVLSQSPEFEAARAYSYCNAAAVYDLLALAVVRTGQISLIVESLERAMKFSFGQRHVWRQRALAAAASTRPHAAAVVAVCASLTKLDNGVHSAGVRANTVLQQAKILAPDDATLRLVGSNTCYDINYIDEGIALAEEAIDIEEKEEGYMLARCYLQAAIGYQMKAQKTKCRLVKQASNDKCLKLLLKSVQLDSNDHLSLYYLALQYTYLGLLNDAMDATRSCLRARSCCAGGLRLLVVLWASGGAAGRERALAAAAVARHHHPAAHWPLSLLADLQASDAHPEVALGTGKELLMMARAASEDSEPTYAELDARSDSVQDRHSVRDGASIRAESAGTYRLERALSEGASSASGAAPPAAHAAQAWLLLANICLRLNRIPAAWGCVTEAATLQPYNHLVLYTRGLVHAARREWEDARQCFQNAIAVNPTHLDSIVNLGSSYYELGWLRLSEKVLREAAQLEPARADTWRRLALVLGALGEHEPAADCAAAALELQYRTPPALHHM